MEIKQAFFRECGAAPPMGKPNGPAANTFAACGEQARLFQELHMES